jgi:HAD superfamily hydrolase (TIGR01549 family)
MAMQPAPDRIAALRGRRHWIFDLDGTLTHPVHDFDAIRRELGVPDHLPILEHLASLPAARAGPLRRRLDAIETAACDRATPRPGAAVLLAWLHRCGNRLGIVSRNSRASVCRTLVAAGLDDAFDPSDLLGRDEAEPKPSPAGIQRLLDRWGAAADDAVMVGDFLFDLQAGRAAGVATVYLDWDGDGRWAGEADVVLPGLTWLPPPN